MLTDARLELIVDDSGQTADLFVYGHVGALWWDDTSVDASAVVRQVRAFNGDLIRVYINSGGGSAMDGVAIYNALRRSSARVDVYIDGIAASAASVIAMAGDNIRMPRGSFLMIHNPYTQIRGFSKDLRATADVLDKMSSEFIKIYKARSNQTEEEITQALDAETWYTPEEAHKVGLIDEIEEAEEVVAYASDRVAIFAGVKIPKEFLPSSIYDTLRPAASISTPPATPKQEAVKMDQETLKKEHPELYKQIVASAAAAAADAAREEGAKAERERIAGIEEAAVPGFEDLVAQAKADPAMDGKDLAWNITQAIKTKGTKFLENRAIDAAETHIKEVPLAETSTAGDKDARRDKLADAMAKTITAEEV